MTLKERVLNRLQGKEVDKTPVGCTTTYGVVDFMEKVRICPTPGRHRSAGHDRTGHGRAHLWRLRMGQGHGLGHRGLERGPGLRAGNTAD